MVKAILWQPIETAPKDGTYFLAYEREVTGHHEFSIDMVRWTDKCPGQPFVCGGLPTSGEWYTHWMPLPDPPESDKA